MRPAYLKAKLARPIPTKDGGMLCSVADARAYMLALPNHRELRSQWQHAASMLIDGANVGDLSRQIELALFYDAKLDVAKIPG